MYGFRLYLVTTPIYVEQFYYAIRKSNKKKYTRRKKKQTLDPYCDSTSMR